jgi:1-acyl-sn-glycerol-3-phosphate acyltransferase
MIGVPFYSLLLSSVILFLDPIAAGSGVSYAKGLSFYMPAAIIALPSLAWALLNMRKSRLVFLLYLASIIASFRGFQTFHSLAGQVLAFAGFGMASALYTALCMNLWPTLYGRRHANRYLGMAASFDLFATAIGPVLFGLLLDHKSISEALQLCLYLPLGAAILFVLATLAESKDPLQSGAVCVSFRASLWDRLILIVSRELKGATLVPFWKMSLRYFPNHHFSSLLWQMLERVEAGQPMTLHVMESRLQTGPWTVIAVHEVLQAHADKFAAFHAIRDQVRDIFYAAHGRDELKGPAFIYHAVPKAMIRHEILNSPEVQKYIQESPDPKAARLARMYFDEIVTDRRYIYARLLSLALKPIFQRLFLRMEIAGIERIRELDRRYQVVYLPSHRSHIDFISTSQLLHLNCIEAPYIAASNHLNFFPVRLLQYVSSYFIRRKKMDPVYNAILYQYMKVLQRYGKSQMVFVEGTRSKTGEVLQPKAGIVSQYINAYLEERARPVVFLPLNITYDFVLEGDSYLQHIIEFRENMNQLDLDHKEAFQRHVSEATQLSRWARLKRFLEFVRNAEPRGSVYLTPGEPIFLDDVLRNHCPDWRTKPIQREEAIPDAWIRDLARHVARAACVEINRVSPLTPSSLVATALLASHGRALSEGELRAYVDTTAELWSKAYGIEIKQETVNLEATLASIPFLNRCRRRRERRSPDVSPAIRNLRQGDRRQTQKVFLSPLDSLRSTYNRNVVIHSFVIPHLLANFLVDRNMVLREEMKEYFFMHYEPLRSRYHLPWEAEGAWRKLEHFLELFEEKGLLSQGSDAILLNHREDVINILGIYARALKSIA